MISKSTGRTPATGRILLWLVLVGAVAVSAVVSIAAPATAGAPRASASSQSVQWPAPPPDRVIALAQAAGLEPEVRESLQHHVHAHLDVFVNGKRVVVPAGIGINIADPGVRKFVVDGSTGYGGISGCDVPCISPLHTHDVTGILHTESATPVDNTLGQFFTEWDVKLTPTCVATYCTPDTRLALYVNGARQPFANAADVDLSDHKEIALVIGRAPARIPKTADFSQA